MKHCGRNKIVRNGLSLEMLPIGKVYILCGITIRMETKSKKGDSIHFINFTFVFIFKFLPCTIFTKCEENHTIQ
jgi:hypothetical protein